MHISQIYARFSAEADGLFRGAMGLAARHRVVRVHHLIAAVAGTRTAPDRHDPNAPAEPPDEPAADGPPRTGPAADPPRDLAGWLPAAWAAHARSLIAAEAAGCLDVALANSPTMRRVLQLACDRAGDGYIAPAHLLAMAACCWGDENPAGRPDASQVAAFCRGLGVRPLPAFEAATPVGPAAAASEAGLDRAPTAAELMALIGPPVTADDLIDLYLRLKETTDPADRERLAARLAYLHDRG